MLSTRFRKIIGFDEFHSPGFKMNIIFIETFFLKKESIVFALYSSNWTKMNIKCKKLILLTMKLNNANHKKLKFTETKIVNLEMFFKVSITIIIL